MRIKMTPIIWCVLLLVSFTTSISAATASDKLYEELMGTWALKIEGKAMFIVELRNDQGSFHGRFEAPSGININNTIFQVDNAKRSEYELVSSEVKGDVLALSFVGDGNKQRSFEMQPVGSKAKLAIPGIPVEAGIGPWIMERVAQGSRTSEDWQGNRSYTVADVSEDSKEMGEIYAADQAARSPQSSNNDDLIEEDKARKKRTVELLDAGELNTGKDLKNAAFVLQHGDAPDDYLLAHSLAVAALAKGEPSAAWIASASLDRYLRSIGRDQIYGTQLSNDAAGNVVRRDFNQELIPNTLRLQLGVPAVSP